MRDDSPNVCVHAGMPRNGNMKPDSKREGRKKKKPICMAYNCVLAIVEKLSPTVSLRRLG